LVLFGIGKFCKFWTDIAKYWQVLLGIAPVEEKKIQFSSFLCINLFI
jgi:hypothetical protein